jgi:hypothetical protein
MGSERFGLLFRFVPIEGPEWVSGLPVAVRKGNAIKSLRRPRFVWICAEQTADGGVPVGELAFAKTQFRPPTFEPAPSSIGF